MNNFFSPSTESFLTSYAKALPQAVLLTGRDGVGLLTLAKHLASQNGTVLSTISPVAKTATSLPIIAVEVVRELYHNARVQYEKPHFIIIDDADRMNTSAQNALLKLLEEPNSSIHFILTSHHPDRLLATIRSRSQLHTVAPISLEQSTKILHQHKVTKPVDIQRMLFIAEGLPAELSRLASDPKTFMRLAERVSQAREFVESNQYRKVAMIVRLKLERQGAIELIEMIVLLLRKSLKQNPDKSTVELIDRLITATEHIRANGNVKLHFVAAATS